jgi:hypothetical protein
MHITANGDTRFAEVLVEALRRLDFDCRSENARVVINSCPANLRQEEIFRRLERVLRAHEAVSADVRLTRETDENVPDDPLLCDLLGHAERHANGVPESCVMYVRAATDLPESLVRALYTFHISSDGEAKTRLVRELASFLR